MDTLKLSTDQTQKIKKYVEEQFDNNVVPALKGSSRLFLLSITIHIY